MLAARGLLLVGLDVIGDCLTEINVTSPTCFQEITEQTGFDVAKMFVDALEAAGAHLSGPSLPAMESSPCWARVWPPSCCLRRHGGNRSPGTRAWR
jgi:hypothetical protein